MQLKSFSDDQLITDAKSITQQERALVTKLLKYLLEIELRRLHLARGFPSLFEFCTDELKLSRAEAHIRIQAMRLMRAVPEVEQKIDAGALTLSVAACIQGTFRRQEKKSGEKIALEEKKAVVATLMDTSARHAEQKLAALYPESAELKEKVKPITEEFTRIEFFASKQLMLKLERLKMLTAHKNYEGRMDVLVEDMADAFLKKVDSKVTKTSPIMPIQMVEGIAVRPPQNDDAAVLRTSKPKLRSRYITKKAKRMVWANADERCEYVDQATGNRCTGAHGLQIDHIHEFAKGGSNEIINLRLLCGAHNRWRSG